MFFRTNCVLNPRINPSTPAFDAQYRCSGGVSRKLAADPVSTIWQHCASVCRLAKKCTAHLTA